MIAPNPLWNRWSNERSEAGTAVPTSRLIDRWFVALVAACGLRRRGRNAVARPTWNAGEREVFLAYITGLIRLREHAQAEAALTGHPVAAVDADCLNLRGVICEAERRWDEARRFYGRAIAADHRHEPAQVNMRRLYELNTFGRSALPMSLRETAPARRIFIHE